MVAFTPNRNYPYSTPTDPADVPGALQSFAEAVDDDLETRDAVINTRPYVKLRGATTTPVTINANNLLPFDIEDFDTDGMADLTVSRTDITIQTAGFYWVYGRLRIYNNGTPPASLFYILTLVHNQVNAFVVARSHIPPAAPDYMDLCASTGKLFAVGDTISLQIAHNNPNDLNMSRFRELAAFKVAV
jgi:hypothetical protein